MKTKEDILNMIEEEDIEFIRLQFTDLLGSLKNIAVTPGQLDRVIANCYSFSGKALFGDDYGFQEDLYLHPDLDSFVVLPWRPQQNKVAKIVCEIYTEDGKPYHLSPRRILRTVLKKAEQDGYSFWIDPECEFFLFHTDDHGLPTTVTHERAGYMDVGPSDFGENARREMVLMLEEMGFDIEFSHHESAPAQHEIKFKGQEALHMADSLQTFRFAVRSVAKRFGLHATFMPKPREDSAGSGMHLGIVMQKGGKNLFRNRDGSLTETARFFIGGILQHGAALTALGCPIVNSYKRLLSGHNAPSHICWSCKGETAFAKLVHNCEDTKVELRFPDGSANPYLILAACIAAGMDGISRQTDPGADCRETGFANTPSVPLTLKDAVNCLKEDELIRGALGEEFIGIYSDIKMREWYNYMTSVSEWEISRYLTRV